MRFKSVGGGGGKASGGVPSGGPAEPGEGARPHGTLRSGGSASDPSRAIPRIGSGVECPSPAPSGHAGSPGTPSPPPAPRTAERCSVSRDSNLGPSARVSSAAWAAWPRLARRCARDGPWAVRCRPAPAPRVDAGRGQGFCRIRRHAVETNRPVFTMRLWDRCLA